ncbi:hypothetical protein CP358_04575 [Lactobacillus sp. UMNPBX7]|nr:hypothetical protein CP364_01800 [Lactobacillus sp. UMNPBX13]PEH00709.1 hypothetical protein CP358_04575 [Lactobacillus sp. UMNPBX7]
MNNLLTLIMTIVRKMTGTTDKLSTSDATSLLDSSKVGLLPVHNILFEKDDDLNNFTDPGQYLIRNTAGTSNLANQHDPNISNGWGTLFVFKNDYYINQIMIDNNFNPARVYHRSKNYVDNRDWTSWNKLGGVVKAVLSALHLERRCLA